MDYHSLHWKQGIGKQVHYTVIAKKKKKKDDLLITCLSSCLDQIWIEMYYGTSADSTIEQKTKVTKSPKHMKGKSNWSEKQARAIRL